jgi:hypothetical protein
MDRSMRRAALDPATLTLPFSMSFSLFLGSINRTLLGWGSLPLP